MTIDGATPETGRDALWPGRIRTLVRELRERPDHEARVAELWRILNLALQRYARVQARRLGRMDSDGAADLAADKALDLMSRIERREWDPAVASDAQVCAFLETVAHHGVIDVLRRRRREAVVDGSVLAAEPDDGAWTPGTSEGITAETMVDGQRYARALLACAAKLTARARRAWVMRVFGGLEVARIARHPEVTTSLGGAHLMLNRARRLIRRCMEAKGFEIRSMPPGTFTALWDLIKSEPQ
jgi:DNA-directed RNA polymerase specialized sigma24 family protein